MSVRRKAGIDFCGVFLYTFLSKDLYERGFQMKKKTLKIIIAVVLIFILLCLGAGLAVYFTVFYPKKNTRTMRAEVNSEKPQYESVLTKTREDFSSDKDYALYLYESACTSFQNCNECAIIDDYVTTTGIKALKLNIPCQGCRFTVKTGTEFYYADYSSAEDNVDSFLDMVGAAEDTLFAKRSYTDISVMDHMYTEKVYRPSVDIDENGAISINADWSLSNSIEGYPKREETPIFHSSQEGMYQQTEMTIAQDTISGATVVYNEELEYYTVSFILDANNPKTSEKLIDNLRSGLKNGNYTSITKVYQIWNNGYFRMCESMDYASNAAMELKLDFKTYFKYGSEDCDPNNYRYFAEAKENALADNNK